MPKKEKVKYRLSCRVIHIDVSIEVIIFLYISNQNSMNGNRTAQNWSNAFTHIEHRAGAFGRTKPQSSLLNIYFRLRGFLSSLQIIHFRHGPNVAPLQKSRRNYRSYA